ncbi:helix-turn-helix domain-containing protein [Streptomyces sp. NPDC057837]|uniref:helix-turn-helix domain-containing protein n=1 Tax=Streptomyces sp. NPDC057837 TaxID=3346260 RepID=UPI0036B3C0C5
MSSKCRIAECTKSPRYGGLCDMHRKRIALHGDPNGVAWSVAERRDRVRITRRMADRGCTATQIARVVGVSERTVYRYLAAAEPRTP